MNVQRSRMLVHRRGRLGAAVSIETIELGGDNAVLAEDAFKRSIAVVRLGRVISHILIVAAQGCLNPWALGARPSGDTPVATSSEIDKEQTMEIGHRSLERSVRSMSYRNIPQHLKGSTHISFLRQFIYNETSERP
jgi:hypothetical protein